MPEITSFRKESNYIFVNSFGKVDLAQIQESIAQVNKLSIEHNCFRLIVDVSKQEVPLELVDTFSLCKNMLPQLPNQLKIAYVICDPPSQPHSFFKILSQAFGCPVEAFFSIEDALPWLDDSQNLSRTAFPEKVMFNKNDTSPSEV